MAAYFFHPSSAATPCWRRCVEPVSCHGCHPPPRCTDSGGGGGSDENATLDLDDLKAHVKYEGGYHSRHKVIKTLWQVVEGLDVEDQGRFIKFVTSVSKPPLLGFQHLKPAFTVRYVPVDIADQEEEGFSFRHLFLGPTQKTARLPTAATCFNTLKLPAYRKKGECAQIAASAQIHAC
jgi:hypothetical protein